MSVKACIGDMVFVECHYNFNHEKMSDNPKDCDTFKTIGQLICLDPNYIRDQKNMTFLVKEILQNMEEVPLYRYDAAIKKDDKKTTDKSKKGK
jgi:hypothetical protein